MYLINTCVTLLSKYGTVIETCQQNILRGTQTFIPTTTIHCDLFYYPSSSSSSYLFTKQEEVVDSKMHIT